MGSASGPRTLALDADECQCYATSRRRGPTGGRAYGWRVTSRDAATAAVVALGGILGALARYAVDLVLPWSSPGFPWATLTVNVIGCALIGVVLVVLSEGPPPAWWLRPFLAVGLIGGFTTFSAFAVETLQLLDDDAVTRAALYVALSLTAGMVAVWFAAMTTRRFVVGRLV